MVLTTRESVLADYIARIPDLHLDEALKTVVVNERSVRTSLLEFLDGAGIPHVDTLPALREAVGGRLYAPTTRDMHPGKNGYRVIGETVAEYLKQLPAER